MVVKKEHLIEPFYLQANVPASHQIQIDIVTILLVVDLASLPLNNK